MKQYNNYYVNIFVIAVIREWVEAGSGDEWGEGLTDMLDGAEKLANSYPEVSEYLWREALEEIPDRVFGFLEEYADQYKADLVNSAINSFEGHFDEVWDLAWDADSKDKVIDARQELPRWMQEHGHIEWIKRFE